MDQLVPLTDEDRQVLTRKQKSAIKVAVIPAIIALLVLASLIVFHTLVFIIVILVVSFVMAITSLTVFLNVVSISKDLRLGQKETISGPVEAQDVDVTRTTNRDGTEGDASYRFWIQIKGKKITLTEDQYYQFKKGDLVEAFIAPKSGTVLDINKEYMRRPFG